MANNRTGQKSYWKIVNNLLNKCKIPRIPPLLISDKFVTSCKEKASLFNNFFVAQCQPIPNASVLPNFHLLTTAKLDTLEISNEQILNILNNLVANTAVSIFALAVFEYENNLLVVTEFLCGHWKVPILKFLKGSK